MEKRQDPLKMSEVFIFDIYSAETEQYSPLMATLRPRPTHLLPTTETPSTMMQTET